MASEELLVTGYLPALVAFFREHEDDPACT